MANHQSALKRIRQTEKKTLRNKYYAKTTRNALRNLLNSKDKKEVAELAPKVTSMLDRLAKRNVIHKNKAANLKSQVSAHLNKM